MLTISNLKAACVSYVSAGLTSVCTVNQLSNFAGGYESRTATLDYRGLSDSTRGPRGYSDTTALPASLGGILPGAHAAQRLQPTHMQIVGREWNRSAGPSPHSV